MIETTLIMDPDELTPYRESWNQLFDQSMREPSTSYEWTNALMINHTKLYSRFFIIIFKHNDNINGIIPMIAREARLFRRKLVTVSPVSELYNTHSDWLVNSYSNEFAPQFLSTLTRLPFKWDLFRMTKLLDNHPLIGDFESSLDHTTFRYRINREPPSFYLPLDDSMEKYLCKRSGKFRNHLKRMQKKLAGKGNIRFVKIDDETDFDNTYQALLRIERNSWKHEHGTAISSVERQTGFYRDFCYEASKTGRLHLLFLYIDDMPIAYDMGFVHGNRYSYLKTSFDEHYKPASPATVLRAKLIELLIDDGIKNFDFPGEPYLWEKQWTDEVRWHKSLVIYNNTLLGRTYHALTILKDALGRQGNNNAGDDIDYHDPKKLQAPRN